VRDAADSSAARERRLQEAIAAYLEASAAGPAPDRQELLARHPDLAAELAAFFADHDKLRQLATPAGADEAPTLAPGAAPLGTVRYFGDYELLERIAEGGMGVVWRARQVSLDRTVALKMIRAGELATAEEVQRFRFEAQAAGNLKHPHIVAIHEVGEHQGQQYYSMDLIDGGSLADAVGRPLEPTRAARLVAVVARAVHHAHQRGLLHRDLKPANVLLDAQGEPHVTDFGLAKSVLADADPGRAASGIVGTPSYMAPEQAAGRPGLTTAADVYSLGAVLYELLTGRPPFRAGTTFDTLIQVMEREPERPRRLNPRVDRDLETVCLKCLHKDPHKRYESAAALAADLERWLAGEPVQARPSRTGERVLKWARRRPAAAALVGVSAAGLLSVLVLAGVLWHQAELRARAEQLRAEEERGLNQRLQEQRDLVLDRERRARRLLYAAHVALAQEALDIGHAARALELLRLERPGADQEDLRGFEWYHLWYRCHRDRLTLRGIPGVGLVSPDGKMVAALVAEDTVRLWTLPDGKECGTLRGQQRVIQDLAFRPDGRILATGDWGGGVKLWDVASAREQGSLLQHQTTINVICFAPDGATVVTGDEAGVLILWDAGQRRARVTLAGHRAALLAALFTPDGKTLVTRDASGVVKLWDVATGHEAATLKGYRGMASCAAISPDGKTLAAGTMIPGSGNLLLGFLIPDIRILGSNPAANTTGKVILWEVATGRMITTLGAHEGMVADVAFAPNGKTLASASRASTWEPWGGGSPAEDHPGQLKLWDLAAGKEKVSQPHPRGIHTLAFSPDGATLAGGAGPFGEIDLWDARSGRFRCSIAGHTGAVAALGFLPDGKTLFSFANDNTFRVWDIDFAPEPLVVPTGETGRGNLAFFPDGKTLVTGGEEQEVARWDTSTGKNLGLGNIGSNGPVALTNDGKMLATVTEGLFGSNVSLWDTASLGLHRTLRPALPEHSMQWPQHVLAFSPRGDVLAAATGGDGLRLWDTATGKGFTTRDPSPGDWVLSVAFGPDGTTLATGVGRGKVTLWDTSTWKKRAGWSGHADEVCALAFSPDGKILASGCGIPQSRTSGEAKLWEAASGKLLATLKGHFGPIAAVTFSPDGKRLATAGADRTVKLWDVVNGQCVATLTGHAGAVDGVAFRADGRMLATASRDGTVRLWHAASDADVRDRDE
jgi:WD40 repeat protein